MLVNLPPETLTLIRKLLAAIPTDPGRRKGNENG
jgi:hypothetical protein